MTNEVLEQVRKSLKYMERHEQREEEEVPRNAKRKLSQEQPPQDDESAKSNDQDELMIVEKEEMEDMALKHSELLAEQRELVMPLRYKKLLDVQEALDRAIFFIKQGRKQIPVFVDVKKSIEQTTRKNFDVTMLRQVLGIVPEFYSHRWELNSKTKDY